MTPGIIFKQKFKQAKDVPSYYFSDSQNYTDREEATLQPAGFEEYQEYMDNQEKTTGLFDFFDEQITESKKRYYKKQFQKAYDEGGLLWQPIISFTDEWLAEQGVIGEDGSINEKLIKQAARDAMKTLLIKEELMGRVHWTGAIHYNTDNIHVHISMVEKNVKRERGVMQQSNLDAAKSKIVSTIVDRTPEQKRINDLMRNEILNNARKGNYKKSFESQFLSIANNIDKSQYGRLTDVEKAQIDKLSYTILKERYPWSYQALQENLSKEEQFYKRTYGAGNRHLYAKYKVNKEAELMSKMGNSILRQAKAHRADENKKLFESRKAALKKARASQIKRYHARKAAFERTGREIAYQRNMAQLSRLRHVMERDTKKALREYEKMTKEKESEYENER